MIDVRFGKSRPGPGVPPGLGLWQDSRAAREWGIGGRPSARSGYCVSRWVLRRWARAGREVEVSTASGIFAGTLVCAAQDHLELRSGRGHVLVGTRAVE